jgi:uncharacterized phage-associated protein
MNAIKVAKYILSISDPDNGDIISHLKLQKLLYYTQGLYLAKFDNPLFNDIMYAWELGPVVRTVYDEYKYNGKEPIDKDFSVFDEEQISHIKLRSVK